MLGPPDVVSMAGEEQGAAKLFVGMASFHLMYAHAFYSNDAPDLGGYTGRSATPPNSLSMQDQATYSVNLVLTISPRPFSKAIIRVDDGSTRMTLASY